jgi:hypothetical protein
MRRLATACSLAALLPARPGGQVIGMEWQAG